MAMPSSLPAAMQLATSARRTITTSADPARNAVTSDAPWAPFATRMRVNLEGVLHD